MKNGLSGHRGLTFIILLAGVLSFTKCAILDDLTREPGGTTTTASPGRVSDNEKELRESVVAYAKRQLGVKYKYAGNTPQTGFDCSGFTCYVMKEFDVALPRTSRTQADEGKKVDLREGQPGDLIFFKRSKTSSVFHVAIVYANDRKGLQVIHSTSRGVVIDNISESDYWQPKIFTIRKVLGG